MQRSPLLEELFIPNESIVEEVTVAWPVPCPSLHFVSKLEIGMLLDSASFHSLIAATPLVETAEFDTKEFTLLELSQLLNVWTRLMELTISVPDNAFFEEEGKDGATRARILSRIIGAENTKGMTLQSTDEENRDNDGAVKRSPSSYCGQLKLLNLDELWPLLLAFDMFPALEVLTITVHPDSSANVITSLADFLARQSRLCQLQLVLSPLAACWTEKGRASL